MKYRMQNLVLAVSISLMVGCVGAQFNDVAPLRSQIEDEYSKSKQLYETADHDFAEKSYAFRNLKSTQGANGLNDQYQSMTSQMMTLGRLRGDIEKAKNQFAGAIKDKKQISSKDATWKDEQAAIKNFNDSMARFNRVLSDYSRESSTFGQIMADRHLVVTAKVTEIRARMADNIENAKKNLKVLDADIQAAKKLARQNGQPLDEASSQTLAAERNAFSAQLKDLEGLFRTLIKNWGGRSRLSSTDSGWNEFQKLLAESEIKSKDLHDIAERLPIEIQSMRLSR